MKMFLVNNRLYASQLKYLVTMSDRPARMEDAAYLFCAASFLRAMNAKKAGVDVVKVLNRLRGSNQ